ncbi:hypothetical protein [Chamaesiphon sp.]|uniref:hypothetical protein n=1 Tax=Chamaesiphon sp. TaxID=2814140 RepID=UPI00359488F5
MKESQSIISQSSNPTQSQPRVEVSPILTNAIFLNVAILAICFTLLVPIYAYISKQRQQKFSIKQDSKVACNRCQYFSSNPYIQCALHPVVVMTTEAIDCKDYSPNERAKRADELSRIFPVARNIFRD